MGEDLLDKFGCSFKTRKGKDVNFQVCKRPHLDGFLKTVSDRYEVHLCTRGKKAYAMVILKELDLTGSIFTKIWAREDLPGGRNDLASLHYPMQRTILIDDQASNHCHQPSNGILINAFEPATKDADDDTALLNVLKVLEKIEKSTSFVRTSRKISSWRRQSTRTITSGYSHHSSNCFVKR